MPHGARRKKMPKCVGIYEGGALSNRLKMEAREAVDSGGRADDLHIYVAQRKRFLAARRETADGHRLGGNVGRGQKLSGLAGPDETIYRAMMASGLCYPDAIIDCPTTKDHVTLGSFGRYGGETWFWRLEGDKTKAISFRYTDLGVGYTHQCLLLTIGAWSPAKPGRWV